MSAVVVKSEGVGVVCHTAEKYFISDFVQNF